jgi:carbon starvation protein
MNAGIIVIIAGLFLILNYWFYGRYIEKKIKPTNNKTPAVLNKDKTDYYPANKYFLFGHHFASIAGAGPIIGPILAVSYFGWLSVVIWIVLGTVFIGAVHDYLSLMLSVRHKAKGIATITSESLNDRSGKVFAIMIWLTLMLIITVFGVGAADSIVAQPSLVIPIIAISIIAIGLGISVYKFKFNALVSTLVALVLAFVFMYLGYLFPIELPFSFLVNRIIWITLLMIYGSIASLVPVWIFLQPRDYLSSIQLILFLALGFLALIVVNPVVNAPLISKSEFPIWPIMFIVVACGAVSGFHSLVASGTTAKQLAQEKHGRFVGYGGMVAEGLLALLVVLMVSSLSFKSGGLNFFDSLDKGWIIAFGNGFGNVVSQLGIPFLSFSIVSLIGAFMVNQFILTSLDTSTRLSRFVLADTFKQKIFKNKFFAVLIIVIPAYLLAITNAYTNIWRLFGSSNQLIAAIALITISAYFVEHKKNIKFLLIPTIFMVVTTISALFYELFNPNGYFVTGNWLLVVISSILILLAIVIFVEWIRIVLKRWKIKFGKIVN